MDDYGGPVWHASGKGVNRRTSRRIAVDALRGVGAAELGEWESDGTGLIVHLVRRLTQVEQERFDVPEPIDIRGTDAERARVAQVLAEAPYLAGRIVSR